MENIEKVFKENNLDEGKVKEALDGKKEEAKEIINDEKKTNTLVEKALGLCDKLSRLPAIGTVFSDVPIACMMIKDYVKGVYKVVPLVSIISITAALIYFVSPVDVIPDVFPFAGYIDDAAVLFFAFRGVHNDIEDYSIWKEGELEE